MPPIDRNTLLSRAITDLGRLTQWNSPIRRTSDLLVLAERLVVRIRKHLAYEEDRVLAFAEATRTGELPALPTERPWDEAFTSRVNSQLVQTFKAKGASDADLRREIVAAAERGQTLGDFTLRLFEQDEAAEEPYLAYLISPDAPVVFGDALIADLRRVLKIPYPPEKKSAKAVAASGTKHQAPSTAKKPKAARPNNKAAEVTAALAKSNAKKGSGVRGQGSGAKAKPATAAIKAVVIEQRDNGSFKASFRKDGHTRSQNFNVAPGFITADEIKSEARRYVAERLAIDSSVIAIKGTVKDRAGTSATVEEFVGKFPKAAPPAVLDEGGEGGTPGNGLPRIYRKEDRWYVEDATGKITGLRKAVTEADAWREGSLVLSSGQWPDQFGPIHGPDGKQGSASANCPAKSTKSAATTPGVTTPVVPDDAFDHLPDGYYLGVAVGQWVLYHCVDGGRERFEITDDFNAVEDAIREACKQHSLDPKDITVLDEDGLTPLPGTGADLLKAEAEAATEA